MIKQNNSEQLFNKETIAKNLEELEKSEIKFNSPQHTNVSSLPSSRKPFTQPNITTLITRFFDNPNSRNLLLGLLIVCFIFISLVTFLNVTAAEKIVPRVTIGKNLLVGGLTKEKALDDLSVRLEELYGTGFTLTYADKQWLVSKEEIGLTLDVNATVEQTWQIGHSSFLISFLERVKSLFFSSNIAPVYTLDREKLELKLSSISREISDSVANASITLENGDFVFHEAKIGTGVNIPKAIQLLEQTLQTVSEPTIGLEIIEIQPTVFKTDLEQQAQALKALLSAPVVLSDGSTTWNLAPVQLATMLQFTKDRDTLTVTVNKDDFLIFLQPIAEKIYIEPVEGKFDWSGGLVSLFVESKNGKELDTEGSYDLINKKISELFTTPDANRTLTLIVKDVLPKVTSENINTLGITELIGEATTSFKGSPAERKHNIKLGLQRVHGHLYAPGDIISFNDSVGTISAATGYQQTWVILGGRTVKGDGGGMCQVSTTFFQAGLKTGFPIVERHAHAYRVKYYEKPPSLGIGYDATVYSPYVDVKFRNDFNSHVLIQGFYNGDNSTITFRFYGTKDARKISITEPKVLSTTPALPDEYIDNEALCPNGQKQVDWAVAGASTIGYRYITYADGSQHTDTIKTNFQPWSTKYERCPCGADKSTPCDYNATPTAPVNNTTPDAKPTVYIITPRP